MKSESLTEKLRIYAYCRYLNDKNEPLLQRDSLKKGKAILHTLKDICLSPRILKGAFFSYIEMPLTTNCNLQCQGCANLMPYYPARPFMPQQLLLEDLDKLLDAVCGIETFGVLGGEPFLYPWIDGILEKLLDSPKIGSVEVITNGAVWPQPSTLAVLRHPKARVRVSHYGDRSRYLDRWRALTDVRVRVLESQELWNDFGPLERTEKPQAAAEEQFARCDPECFSFYQGNIYCCPRAGHGSDLGVIRLSDREVAHIRTSESAEKRKKEIEKLKGIRYSEACYYCLSGTDRFKRIDYE